MKCDEWENPHRKHLQERDGHRLKADPGCAAVFARELPRGNARTGHLRYGVKSARCMPRMWVVPRRLRLSSQDRDEGCFLFFAPQGYFSCVRKVPKRALKTNGFENSFCSNEARRNTPKFVWFYCLTRCALRSCAYVGENAKALLLPR